MLATLKKYLLVPKLVRLSAGAPRDHHIAWDRFWSGVKTTGATGDVLWDSGSDHEMQGYLGRLRLHLDPGLPVVDIGCGNGSFTRQLAWHFPHAVGVDVSDHAVRRARTESAGLTNVSYALAENVRAITGVNGRVFLAETDFQGNAIDYVSHLGATLRSIPAPLEGAIRGLPMPGRFGPRERGLAFPESRWELIEDGPATIETMPLSNPTRADLIPGYFAVLRARNLEPLPPPLRP